MKFLSAFTGSDWVSLTLEDERDGAARQAAESHREALKRFLTEILLSDNLVVLCGQGTTAYLNNRRDTPIAPSMGSLWREAQEQSGDNFKRVLKEVKYESPADEGDIELLLSHCHLSQRLRPSELVETFTQQTQKLIADKCRFVNGGVDLHIHRAFLMRVGRRPSRQPRMKLFTTNYDLCFERAASESRFIVVDGFSHTQPQEFDGSYFTYDFVRREQSRDKPDFIPNVFHLYKMHGSVDWELQAGRIVRAGDTENPLMVYPRYTKFESSYEPPFIEMMSRFQIALREPNTGLLVVGVGLNDNHISQPVASAIRSNVSLKAMLVGPGLEKNKRFFRGIYG